MCFFPFDVSDGKCGIIISVPDHCLLFCLEFYFAKIIYYFTLLFHDRKYDILDMINTNIGTHVNKIVDLYQASAECLKAYINIGRSLLHKRW